MPDKELYLRRTRDWGSHSLPPPHLHLNTRPPPAFTVTSYTFIRQTPFLLCLSGKEYKPAPQCSNLQMSTYPPFTTSRQKPSSRCLSRFMAHSSCDQYQPVFSSSCMEVGGPSRPPSNTWNFNFSRQPSPLRLKIGKSATTNGGTPRGSHLRLFGDVEPCRWPRILISAPLEQRLTV